MAVQSATAVFLENKHGHFLENSSVVSLIQGRKTKQRRKPRFSTEGSWVEQQNKKNGGKQGNWDIQSFLTVDGLGRLTLPGFRHTAPRPPFSLSPGQAESGTIKKRE